MKIAIDCRYIGMSGIGRVCEGIVGALDFSENEYYLIGKRDKLANYTDAHIIADDTNPYTPAGLRSFDRKLNRLCDALLIPNFLVPFGVKLPICTVMHDLAFLDVKETTRGFCDAFIKKTLLKRCMKKSDAISCISEFTRSRCEQHFGKLAKKCFVNYNGITENVFSYARTHANTEKTNTIVFVGNLKLYKGLPTLLNAFSRCKGGMTLKIIGRRYNSPTGFQFDENAYDHVEFTGEIGDDALFEEIARAKYLVLPSKYEGFGLPPLEALALGTQPIVSDIPVFHEVYAGLPVKFFRTEDELTALLEEKPEQCSVLKVIEERYNYSACAKKLVETIMRL